MIVVAIKYVMDLKMKEGCGGVNIHDISFILPDTTNPKHSVVYIGVDSVPVSVQEECEELVPYWEYLLQKAAEGSVDEEDEEDEDDD